MSRSHLFVPTIACLVLFAAPSARAADPEAICQLGRYKAAGKYALCANKVLGKFRATLGTIDNAKLSKCRVKYAAVWTTLQAKTSGTGATCDAPRFADNGDGTVTDRLTGLQWEKKTTTCTDDHCVSTNYRWSQTIPQTDGTLFKTFVPALADGCFAGQCDWHVPTLLQLQTILLEPYPCTTAPCIDSIFGATDAASYWTSDSPIAVFAFYIGFGDGTVSLAQEDSQFRARGVRGDL
jgi:hypothetical protein